MHSFCVANVCSDEFCIIFYMFLQNWVQNIVIFGAYLEFKTKSDRFNWLIHSCLTF